MGVKTFKDKKIIIRRVVKGDINKVTKFLAFVNSFVEEDAKIGINKKLDKPGELKWLKNIIEKQGEKTRIYLIAEHDDEIVGSSSVELGRGRKDHTAEFGITIRQGYRGIGLGKHMMAEIIKLAKKELKPRPKIINLWVFINNKPAISLYKKMGFKIVAKIPKQLQYKGKHIAEFFMMKEL